MADNDSDRFAKQPHARLALVATGILHFRHGCVRQNAEVGIRRNNATLYCWFLAVPLDLGLPLASSITAAWLVLYSIFGGPDMTPRHLNLDFRRHHGRVLRRFVGRRSVLR